MDEVEAWLTEATIHLLAAGALIAGVIGWLVRREWRPRWSGQSQADSAAMVGGPRHD